ncbi:MAG: DUF433 domain-containing protein [Planctomycetes bacterium]|nr:DUF433 domain-containing protein [Planctomycetota bacterium]
MDDAEILARIAFDPKILTGKPVIRGTRLSVEYILNLIAHGATYEEILDEYEGLSIDDIYACLLFATKSISDSSFMPLSVGKE